MRIACPLGITSMLALAFCAVPGQAWAEEYRSDSGHFRLQVPPNWVRLDAQKTAQVKNGMRNDPNAIYHEGFEPRNFQQGAVILVIEATGKRNPFETYDQIERSLDKEFRQEFLRGAGGNVNLGPIVLDRAKNRFVAQTDSRAPNGAKLPGVMFGFLGKQNVVIIACVALEFDFANQRPTFDTMADSFQFDPDFQFVPFDGSKVLVIVAGVGASLCCVLGLIAILIGIIAFFMMKR